MADKLIDIGLILFFGGFGFVCYINGVCGIGKDHMQRNKIDFVRWMFNPKHILRSNTPFDSNEPLELKFKEPKSKHIIYNFFELIIHYAIIAPFLVICGDFSILRGARHQNFILNLKFATRMQSGHCIDAVFVTEFQILRRISC